MPVTRAARRLVTNENDENTAVAASRLTRAKNAAVDAGLDPVKKPVARTTRTAAAAGAVTRRRAALGDVSNVVKTDSLEVSSKEPTKRTTRNSTLAKAAAPTKVTKSTTQKPVRSTTVARDRATNGNGMDSKKATASSAMSRPLTKRRTAAAAVDPTEVETNENIPGPDSEDVDGASANGEVAEREQEALTQPAAHVSENEPKAAPTSEEQVDEIVDIDADEYDPIMVSEYAPEIYEYLRQLEPSSMPDEEYMEQQPELEWKMRGILVDWLIEVHTRFRLLPETLFLTVNIVDRFLSCKVVQLDRLQLVGITAMFIASKYEEVLSPHIQSFRVVADNGFTEEEILRAERYMLQALNYDLSYPNPMNFLRRISKADQYNIETRTLGKYLLEISCLDHRFLAYPASQVAAAAMYFARLVLSRGRWDATLTYYSGYSEEELYDVFLLMMDYVRRPVVHRAFFTKYSEKKYMKASYILRQWVKKCYQHFMDENDFHRDY